MQTFLEGQKPQILAKLRTKILENMSNSSVVRSLPILCRYPPGYEPGPQVVTSIGAQEGKVQSKARDGKDKGTEPKRLQRSDISMQKCILAKDLSMMPFSVAMRTHADLRRPLVQEQQQNQPKEEEIHGRAGRSRQQITGS